MKIILQSFYPFKYFYFVICSNVWEEETHSSKSQSLICKQRSVSSSKRRFHSILPFIVFAFWRSQFFRARIKITIKAVFASSVMLLLLPFELLKSSKTLKISIPFIAIVTFVYVRPPHSFLLNTVHAEPYYFLVKIFILQASSSLVVVTNAGDYRCLVINLSRCGWQTLKALFDGRAYHRRAWVMELQQKRR